MAGKPKRAEGVGPVSAAEYLKRPYTRLLVPEEGGGYRAEILEFPGCIAEGDTPGEAIASLEAVAESWLEAAAEMGSPIPRPMDECEFSGKFVLRLPKSLHRKAALAAQREKVSLNQFIVTGLAEQIGTRARVASPSAQVFIFEAKTTTRVITNTKGSLEPFTPINTDFNFNLKQLKPPQEYMYANS